MLNKYFLNKKIGNEMKMGNIAKQCQKTGEIKMVKRASKLVERKTSQNSKAKTNFHNL